MLLVELNQGEKAIITKVKGVGAFRKRIMEMGFLVGREIEVIKKAPFKDPVEYLILGYHVSLRNSEAELIEVQTVSENVEITANNHNLTDEEEILKRNINITDKKVHIVFVGNPNSGKTTLFNKIGKANERVGNYAGVTVAAKELEIQRGDTFYKITDLPGTYSLTAYSPEEMFVRDYILKNQPDVIVNVVDATNLERNLYLTTQLIDMDMRVVIALNMYDEFEQSGNILNYSYLGKLLGIPIVPTVATRGRGIHNLLLKASELAYDNSKTYRHIRINYGEIIENSILEVSEKLKELKTADIFNRMSIRFFALKLLEKDSEAIDLAKTIEDYKALEPIINKQSKKLENIYNDSVENVLTDSKYSFISGALKETLKIKKRVSSSTTDKIDNILTHKYFGIPIFFFFMWLTFYSTFFIGQYPQEWINLGVEKLSDFLSLKLPEGILSYLLIDGIIAGVGSVLSFLPNILILYFFISLMEDTGYMSRAVFIMDKAMHLIGLHGKSFIPLLMGFGCNVPAIISTRIIESKRDRLVTMLINPFMSCSARLPVYILIISAFFSNNQGNILFMIYIIGILLAIFTALLLQKTMFKKIDLPFVMELPPYRIPTVRNTVYQMLNRTSIYLKKITGIILVASVVIWVLNFFPRTFEQEHIYNEKITELENLKTNGTEITSIDESIKGLQIEKNAEQRRYSYIGRLGQAIEPVMKPLGYDWKMSVSLLSGIVAKEVVVGTMAVLYHSPDDDNYKLSKNLQNEVYNYGEKKGEKVFSPLVAISFMLFILIYFPCVGVIAAIKKESGKWKWALFTAIYTTSLAYIVSLLVYQIGKFFV